MFGLVSFVLFEHVLAASASIVHYGWPSLELVETILYWNWFDSVAKFFALLTSVLGAILTISIINARAHSDVSSMLPPDGNETMLSHTHYDHNSGTAPDIGEESDLTDDPALIIIAVLIVIVIISYCVRFVQYGIL